MPLNRLPRTLATTALVTALLQAAGPHAQRAAVPAAVSPFPRGLTGSLVFQSDAAGRDAIYVLDLAGGSVRRLSGDPGWTEGSPRWSPDGSKVLFKSNRAHYEGGSPEQSTPDFDLYLVNADGSGQRRLTTDAANENDPAWMPDGRSVVYSSDRDSRGDLYRLWLDTGRVDRLTRHFVGRAIMPSPSPDGARIAFAAQTLRVGEFWNYQVHVLDVASGRSEAVATSAGSCWPTWSRDGAWLAYVLLGQGPSSLEARDARGGVRRLVAEPALWSYYPEWSPDGNRLAFSVSPAHHEGQDWDLAVLDTTTGTWQRLTQGRGNDRLADWKP